LLFPSYCHLGVVGMADAVVPSGYSQPVAVVTKTNHSAWIIIAAILGIVYAIIFGTIRIMVRFVSGSGFGWDDYSLGIATVRLP
jgi:hypothetical protein